MISKADKRVFMMLARALEGANRIFPKFRPIGHMDKPPERSRPSPARQIDKSSRSLRENDRVRRPHSQV